VCQAIVICDDPSVAAALSQLAERGAYTILLTSDNMPGRVRGGIQVVLPFQQVCAAHMPLGSPTLRIIDHTLKAETAASASARSQSARPSAQRLAPPPSGALSSPPATPKQQARPATSPANAAKSGPQRTPRAAATARAVTAALRMRPVSSTARAVNAAMPATHAIHGATKAAAFTNSGAAPAASAASASGAGAGAGTDPADDAELNKQLDSLSFGLNISKPPDLDKKKLAKGNATTATPAAAAAAAAAATDESKDSFGESDESSEPEDDDDDDDSMPDSDEPTGIQPGCMLMF